MSITVAWDNTEKTIVCAKNMSPWTWEEFDASHVEIRTLLSSVPHKVDVIIDISEGGEVPPNAITHFAQTAKNSAANQGTLVFVGGGLFDKVMMQTVGKIAPPAFKEQGVYFVATREEAHQLLEPHK